MVSMVFVFYLLLSVPSEAHFIANEDGVLRRSATEKKKTDCLEDVVKSLTLIYDKLSVLITRRNKGALSTEQFIAQASTLLSNSEREIREMSKKLKHDFYASKVPATTDVPEMTFVDRSIGDFSTLLDQLPKFDLLHTRPFPKKFDLADYDRQISFSIDPFSPEATKDKLRKIHDHAGFLTMLTSWMIAVGEHLRKENQMDLYCSFLEEGLSAIMRSSFSREDAPPVEQFSSSLKTTKLALINQQNKIDAMDLSPSQRKLQDLSKELDKAQKALPKVSEDQKIAAERGKSFLILLDLVGDKRDKNRNREALEKYFLEHTKAEAQKLFNSLTEVLPLGRKLGDLDTNDTTYDEITAHRWFNIKAIGELFDELDYHNPDFTPTLELRKKADSAAVSFQWMVDFIQDSTKAKLKTMIQREQANFHDKQRLERRIADLTAERNAVLALSSKEGQERAKQLLEYRTRIRHIDEWSKLFGFTK